MSDRIRFILDGKVKDLAGVDPTLTVLRWLREVERRTGTKEGCAEGDCGVCTPGFVMSLVALYESEPEPSRQRLDDVLARNLCRCTGYRPIVAAARQAYDSGAARPLAAQEAALTALLASIQRRDTLALEHGGRRFFAPRSLDALADLVG